MTLQPAHHAASLRLALDRMPEGLTSLDRLVLVTLMLHADAAGFAVVSRPRLAGLVGAQARTVKASMGRLREAGLLGEAVLTSDGSGYRTYKHPIRPPREPATGLSWADWVEL